MRSYLFPVPKPIELHGLLGSKTGEAGKVLDRDQFKDEELKAMAKFLVNICIRDNTSLEDYHAEGVPVNDARMKKLMIECVDNVYVMLRAILNGKRDSVLPAVMLYAETFVEDWDEPKVPAWYSEMRDLLAEINNEEPK